MADEVFMDIPRVEQMSKSFNTFGSILEGVSKALLAISIAMKATAWISFGATAAAAAYADRIRPNVDKAAQKMHELSDDIMSAIRAYRDGDMSGSKRFI
jgi:type II secretory pathway component PulF